MTEEKTQAKLDQGLHLRFGEGPVAERAPRVHQLDSNGPGVDVRMSAPMGDAGVPGPFVLGHQTADAPVLFDDIMGADLGLTIAKPPIGGFRAFHAGIMQHQHIDDRAPIVKVQKRVGR